jgi:hypothetical protein
LSVATQLQSRQESRLHFLTKSTFDFGNYLNQHLLSEFSQHLNRNRDLATKMMFTTAVGIVYSSVLLHLNLINSYPSNVNAYSNSSVQAPSNDSDSQRNGKHQLLAQDAQRSDFCPHTNTSGHGSTQCPFHLIPSIPPTKFTLSTLPFLLYFYPMQLATTIAKITTITQMTMHNLPHLWSFQFPFHAANFPTPGPAISVPTSSRFSRLMSLLVVNLQQFSVIT